jgi:F-type H+-transporting ATPase subunit a
MEKLVNEIQESLNCSDAFVIPVFGGIHIAESVFVTWIIMAIMVIGSILITRNLKVTNCSKRQLLLEAGYTWLYKFFKDTIGENGTKYIPYMITIIVYIGIANIFGIFGMKPPTKDLNVTIALALMSIVLVQIASIRQKKVKGWLKSFAEPVAIVAPINILELAIRPLSLCMRLFGNVLGAFVIIKLIEGVAPVIIPPIFSLYFDFFDGFIQAYVFTFLTSLYIREAVE